MTKKKDYYYVLMGTRGLATILAAKDIEIHPAYLMVVDIKDRRKQLRTLIKNHKEKYGLK